MTLPVHSSLTGFATISGRKGCTNDSAKELEISESDAMRVRASVSSSLSDIFIITIYDSIRHRKSSLGRYWRVKMALPCEEKNAFEIRLKRNDNVLVMKLTPRAEV